MSDELTTEDWKQIALFYQKKHNELEMNILAAELAMSKQAQEQASNQAVQSTDEDE